MPFTDIAPPEIRSSKSGISCSLADGKRGAAGIFRISFTKAAQEQIFGGPIAGKRFFAKAGRGQDEGRLLLTPHEDGDLVARASMHGSASIKMRAWDLLPKSKRPALAVEKVDETMGGHVFQLPPWARPTGVGGKIEADHALRRSGGSK